MSSINQKVNDKGNRNLVRIEGADDEDLANVFNDFCCFEKHDFSENMSHLEQFLSPDKKIVIAEENVRDYLKHINFRKAPGSDLISGCTLWYYADQLSVLQRMFQMSLNCNYIAEIGKSSIVVPVRRSCLREKLKDL